MTELMLFHHALGATPGVHAFADRLRAERHTVHVPDLFEGRTFDTVEDGVAHVQEVGVATILERGRAAAAGLPDGLVHAGFSLGVLPAQLLAQTRPGARGAVLMEACLPPAEFGGWPEGVPVQVHGMIDDPFFAGEGDLAAARALVATDGVDGELFTYPGAGHLFADPGLPSYDEDAARLLTDRVLDFLDRVG
ncbi:dienelactone hydrolase family protein [Nocardioides sp. SYSU DS0663]|uniref:dienelactone hydrolase family protein n=1 Tax=Nocardioides sp. SYSU DS0663 TaxID=3416445 RepID=UPI003F4BCF01